MKQKIVTYLTWNDVEELISKRFDGNIMINTTTLSVPSNKDIMVLRIDHWTVGDFPKSEDEKGD